MPEKVKRMDIKEFREKGYLQEANRLFFHPLGLALEVIINEETGEEKLGGIWDFRDDPEGLYFDIKNKNKDDINVMRDRCDFIHSEKLKRMHKRKKRFNDLPYDSHIEPIDY
jgi:hypothetical protein